ncbi:hypothetical protein BC567DRAFT_226954 [Phyllosticta citribraziliensis]
MCASAGASHAAYTHASDSQRCRRGVCGSAPITRPPCRPALLMWRCGNGAALRALPSRVSFVLLRRRWRWRESSAGL